MGIPVHQARSQLAAPLLLLATVLCLVPFADKAFHIDDPLFVWVGQHIRQDCTNFYGFKVNWDYTFEPISEITKNPPLACYYAALASCLEGWNEVGLHLAFLLPALGAVWGTYRLAEMFCGRPIL